MSDPKIEIPIGRMKKAIEELIKNELEKIKRFVPDTGGDPEICIKSDEGKILVEVSYYTEKGITLLVQKEIKIEQFADYLASQFAYNFATYSDKIVASTRILDTDVEIEIPFRVFEYCAH